MNALLLLSFIFLSPAKATDYSGNFQASTVTASFFIGNGSGLTGIVGGTDTEVQYNNGGFFGGDNHFVWDNSTHRLTIGVGGPDSTQPLTLFAQTDTALWAANDGISTVYNVITQTPYSILRIFGDVSAVSLQDFFFFRSDGTSGFGTSTPAYPLDVVGDAQVSGKLHIGYEINTTSCPAATTCAVSCSADTVATGGGCDGDTVDILKTFPSSTTQWECETLIAANITSYVICARIGGL